MTSKQPPAKKAGAKRPTNAALAEQVSVLAAQMQVLMSQQENLLSSAQGAFATPVPAPSHGQMLPPALPPVSAGMMNGPVTTVSDVAKAVGPPPRARPPATIAAPDALSQDPETGLLQMPVETGVTQAIMQQSQALTALVSHLASGDPIADLSAASSTAHGLATKGVARRERMQQELAVGSSNLFLQVQQQIFRKMYPARPVPKTEQELIAAGVSMTGYLERFGGYKGKHDQGLLMRMLAHCMDAASNGDVHKLKEYLAITTACLEQATMDGNWQIAYVLSLLEEPPSQLFSERSQAVSALGRPFSPLIPAAWSAIALAYLKEVDLLSNKKAETKGTKNVVKQEDAQDKPSPKRRPKFPKKPKQGGEASETSG